MKYPRRVLITGASSGIGRAIAGALIKEDYEVIGTSRHPEKILAENRIIGVEYQPLELTDELSITTLIKKVEQVDILINNAGLGQLVPVEEAPMERVRNLFELNLFGAIRLIQGFLPAMRERGYGWIVNIGSMAGRIAVPFSSLYAAAKAGLESLSRGLRYELADYGIKVVVIAPQYIHTPLQQETIIQVDSPFYDHLMLVKLIRDRHIALGLDPEVVARKVVKILKKKRPAAFYPVGRNAALFAFLKRYLPAGFSEKQVQKKFRLK